MTDATGVGTTHDGDVAVREQPHGDLVHHYLDELPE
jgi:hypothetical protein